MKVVAHETICVNLPFCFGAALTLGEGCAKTEWQIHAYCLMRNHFHLVLAKPQPNLVFGMKWLLGTYTKRFNIRHKICGHLFAGRYKALAVDGSANGCELCATMCI